MTKEIDGLNIADLADAINKLDQGAHSFSGKGVVIEIHKTENRVFLVVSPDHTGDRRKQAIDFLNSTGETVVERAKFLGVNRTSLSERENNRRPYQRSELKLLWSIQQLANSLRLALPRDHADSVIADVIKKAKSTFN